MERGPDWKLSCGPLGGQFGARSDPKAWCIQPCFRDSGPNHIKFPSPSAATLQPQGKIMNSPLPCGGFHKCLLHLLTTAVCSTHLLTTAASVLGHWIGLDPLLLL